MLHDELRPRGIHIGHTAIDGAIGPGKDHEPDEITDLLWRHHTDRDRFHTRGTGWADDASPRNRAP